jgi:hypothetical protein
VAEVLYKAQPDGSPGAESGGAAPGGAAGKEDDVIDAEYTEEKGNS